MRGHKFRKAYGKRFRRVSLGRTSKGRTISRRIYIVVVDEALHRTSQHFHIAAGKCLSDVKGFKYLRVHLVTDDNGFSEPNRRKQHRAALITISFRSIGHKHRVDIGDHALPIRTDQSFMQETNIFLPFIFPYDTIKIRRILGACSRPLYDKFHRPGIDTPQKYRKEVFQSLLSSILSKKTNRERFFFRYFIRRIYIARNIRRWNNRIDIIGPLTENVLCQCQSRQFDIRIREKFFRFAQNRRRVARSNPMQDENNRYGRLFQDIFSKGTQITIRSCGNNNRINFSRRSLSIELLVPLLPSIFSPHRRTYFF